MYRVPGTSLPRKAPRSLRLSSVLTASLAFAVFLGPGWVLAQDEGRPVRRAVQPKSFENSVGMRMVRISPGSFLMGAKENEPAREDETRHEVTLTRSFYLSAHEVTVEQFRKFVEETKWQTDAERGGQDFEKARPGGFMVGEDGGPKFVPGANWQALPWEQTGRHPVVFLSWNDAQAFVEWLGKKEGRRYRLPTEAEWEYACRAGSATAYWWGDEPDETGLYANLGDWSFRKHFPTLMKMMEMDDKAPFTTSVGSYRPNAFGLHDMIGNAWEWVDDTYAPYKPAAVVNPHETRAGADRIARGGGFGTTLDRARCAARFHDRPENRFAGTGLRVAMDPEQ